MRRIYRFDHLFLSLTTALIFSSCGIIHKSAVKEQNTSFSATEAMTAIRDLTTDERAIATRICYAYQSKYSNFQTTNYLGKTFNFSITNKDCDGNSAQYNISAVLTAPQANVLSFVTSSSQPFSSVIQTNQAGFLSQLCGKIQTNATISNTADYNGYKIQVSFIRNGIDSYVLKYFTQNTAGTMQIQSAETYKTRTQFDLSGAQILGMDELFSRQQVCINNTSKYTDFNQQFINIVQ